MNIVILCGGSGSRLFPLSTKDKPKQFLRLTDEKYTMFQLTCLRIQKLDYNKLIIITGIDYLELVKEQIKDLVTNYVIVVEPFGRNTAPAITISCLLSDDDDKLLVLSSDQVWNDDKFIDCINKGKNNSNITIFGIKPNCPHTGYGYIEYENDKLISFVEKPTNELAQIYIEKGYLWNSGIFLFKNSVMKNKLIKYSNSIWKSTLNTFSKSQLKNHILFLNDIEFAKVEDLSIDYAVMEHLNDGNVIKYDGYWNDIGSFQSLYEHCIKDKNNNILNGDIYLMNTTNSYINSNKKTGIFDLSNIVVINTPDILLIGDINKSQNVKIIKKMMSL